MELLLFFLLFGALLGLFFFGGLWLTVRALPRLKHPQATYWAGSMLRLAVCLYCFSVALGQGPLYLAAACVGFYALRMGLVPWVGRVRPGQGEEEACR
jgi:F1F0 ATPase subunit 2